MGTFTLNFDSVLLKWKSLLVIPWHFRPCQSFSAVSFKCYKFCIRKKKKKRLERRLLEKLFLIQNRSLSSSERNFFIFFTQVRPMERPLPVSAPPPPGSTRHQPAAALASSLVFFFFFWTLPPWLQHSGCKRRWKAKLPQNDHYH